MLTNASKQILAKLVTYYDNTIVEKQDLLQSVDNEQAKLKLSPQEMIDLESFCTNISHKKEAIEPTWTKRELTNSRNSLNPQESSLRLELILEHIPDNHLRSLETIPKT